MAPEPAERQDVDARESKVSWLPSATKVHRSQTVDPKPQLTINGVSRPPTNEVRSLGELPVSPLVAASTAGEHYPSHRLSYAHQQSVSGWDKVFSHISQRNEYNADEANHEHGQPLQDKHVSELNDEFARGDVQYVDDWSF
ncbi:hypothetical protein H4R22_002858 [Coemansia sp. RSA 1290]|nr:hypothetical protein H4R22_002858 [Coemansia sp. RSA 1290]